MGTVQSSSPITSTVLLPGKRSTFCADAAPQTLNVRTTAANRGIILNRIEAVFWGEEKDENIRERIIRSQKSHATARRVKEPRHPRRSPRRPCPLVDLVPAQAESVKL